jgi:5-dehydro-2-deoxygluconokinase
MDVITMGRATVDLFANEFDVPLEEVKTFSKYVGGCPANIATAAAQLGLETGIITKIGGDACGNYVKKYLASKKVDISHVSCDEKSRTGLALGEISPPDNFKILYYRENAADLNLSIEDIDKNYISKTKTLIISGTALSRSPSREACLVSIEHALANRVKVVVDLDYRDGTWSSSETAAYYLGLAIQKADVVIGTEKEVEIATNHCKDYNKDIVKKGKLKLLVIKNGSAGSTAYTGENIIKSPAFNINIVNTIGAGDGFCAGLTYGLINEFPLEKSLHYANAIGAISVSKQSCSDSYPSLQELEEFLKLNR